MYRHFLKRFIDFIISLTALLVLCPVFVLVIVFLLFANQGKVFFFQPRPGKDAEIFTVIKFKTMNDKKDTEGHLLPDKDRLTPVGRFVRKASLDEIPQLLNVLIGDMSLVGPRPLLVEYLPLYNNVQKRRHNVKPGITGWAQVNGRNAISWQQKFELDVWYSDNISLLLDLKILMKTFIKVVKSEGISATNTVTMEKFTGN